VVTIVWCASRSSIGELPIPGGWTMSMAWRRLPGKTWPGTAAACLRIRVVMRGDHAAVRRPNSVVLPPGLGRTGKTRLGRLTARVGMGCVFVWTVFGMALFGWALRGRRSR
jgi:hypothetical protein